VDIIRCDFHSEEVRNIIRATTGTPVYFRWAHQHELQDKATHQSSSLCLCASPFKEFHESDDHDAEPNEEHDSHNGQFCYFPPEGVDLIAALALERPGFLFEVFLPDLVFVFG
jgi:hypothetical protein